MSTARRRLGRKGTSRSALIYRKTGRIHQVPWACICLHLAVVPIPATARRFWVRKLPYETLIFRPDRSLWMRTPYPVHRSAEAIKDWIFNNSQAIMTIAKINVDGDKQTAIGHHTYVRAAIELFYAQF
jgi:hypothetical protein